MISSSSARYLGEFGVYVLSGCDSLRSIIMMHKCILCWYWITAKKRLTNFSYSDSGARNPCFVWSIWKMMLMDLISNFLSMIGRFVVFLCAGLWLCRLLLFVKSILTPGWLSLFLEKILILKKKVARWCLGGVVFFCACYFILPTWVRVICGFSNVICQCFFLSCICFSLQLKGC